MKKLAGMILILCLLPGFIMPCRAGGADISATAAIVMDADTGQVLYEKNADRRMLIASTTKIMTALAAIEYGGLRRVVKVKPEHMTEGSSMYLRPGEEITVFGTFDTYLEDAGDGQSYLYMVLRDAQLV